MKSRRHSKKRESILEVLKRSHGAFSARDIHKKLPDVDLATIYRNLDLFVSEGQVKKLNLGGDEALYEFTKEAHHHAICTDCDRVIHFTAPEEKIKKLLDLKDFNIESIEITVKGTCRH